MVTRLELLGKSVTAILLILVLISTGCARGGSVGTVSISVREPRQA
ncbi:MAG: hypothetical protein QN152_00010 [Armatimonadota bacterium]|nr:hypothetical protein [Armatimonadota bacterium]MDR7465389.1 hypothetical protein [Armatimonadota bacterium]MDR7475713.1 hypothetical protein [Armatimonadota bacterium]MDR7537900.1 hypothetical protein [Armatimonadota bacterium]